jgi:hypothetical protein
MPSVSSVHVDAALSNVSVQYKQAAYVAERILPSVQVAKRSDNYFIYRKLDTFSQIDPLTSPNSEVPRTTYEISTGSYSVKDYAFKDFVSRDLIENADAPLVPLADTTEDITNKLLLDREIKLAASLFSTSVITNNATIASTAGYSAVKWTNASSTPVQDILNGLASIVGVEGPFCALFGFDAFKTLRTHPDMLAALQFTQGGVAASEAQIRDFFGFEDVIIAEGWKNTATVPSTASYSRIWGDSVLIFKRGRSLAVKEVALGYCLQFGNREVQRWADYNFGARGGEWVKVGWSYTDELTAVDSAFLLDNVI